MAEKQKESTPCQNSAKICAAANKMYCVKTDRSRGPEGHPKRSEMILHSLSTQYVPQDT